jgi:hypothetical protein
MPVRERLLHCGCIGLAVASFMLIGAIVAQPILDTLWPSHITTARLAQSRNLSEQGNK